ncbi:STAS domain-containing protein [Streptomyces sp. NPDC060011]|uniref:STAS domain-containing protein n=1 Tax=unclassified Streptomyces TaxID=2593676 RepID=UPI0013B7C9FA|nr:MULTISPECIES: STAS domain-containing protein [unclassified Streptomyces]NEB27769.1 STAS domain-containing protein [Streptomyces sp. SID14446]MCX4918872.1 STAS domain-containing protein [Streptomyces sp. NBC_00687]MCX5134871.1 STAS domain-containing protein [Streptomyces sp. NBC_00340]MCX5281023.1 STAS domain-containing protein [Streptomyces sp. NBC_00198]WSK59229.1 STAS domain-containing protein [Streptomyces sp. NBC_01281]
MTERVPVLQIGQVLLVSIQTDLDDQSVMLLQDDLAAKVVETGAHGVVIDITAVDIVDSFVGRMLSTIASISRLLDAQTVVVGMRPAVAITLVELGLSLGGVRTALTLDKGLRVLEQARAESLGESDPDGPSDLGVGGVAPDAAAGL